MLISADPEDGARSCAIRDVEIMASASAVH